MKKILGMLLVASLLACNSQNNKDNGGAPAPAADHRGQEENTAGLSLNNGAKWKTDSTTLVNITLLKAIVSGAKMEGIDNYTQIANQLQGGLNKMIRECTMKGADHDALHQWLEPLIGKTKELKEAASPGNAMTILNEIGKHIDLFEQYFE